MTCGPMPAPASKRERDKQKVLKLLWMMPLADVHTLANRAELEKNRCYRLLTDTAGDKQVAHATLGRGSDVRSLFWLSRRGVLDVEKLTGWKIPWQVSETEYRLAGAPSERRGGDLSTFAAGPEPPRSGSEHDRLPLDA